MSIFSNQPENQLNLTNYTIVDTRLKNNTATSSGVPPPVEASEFNLCFLMVTKKKDNLIRASSTSTPMQEFPATAEVV